MNGEMMLKHAAGVFENRREQYGDPSDLFDHIAKRWSLVLGAKVTPAQVARLTGEGLSFQVEASPLRAFADDDYVRAGAHLVQGAQAHDHAHRRLEHRGGEPLLFLAFTDGVVQVAHGVGLFLSAATCRVSWSLSASPVSAR